MTWPIEILKIYLEEQLQVKYYAIKHLILSKIQIMVEHRRASLVYKCLKIFGKSFLVLTLKVE